LLSYTIMQVLSDSLLLATTNRQKLLFQLPAVDYRREDIRDRLEEVDVVIDELSPFDRVCPQHTIGLRTAVDNHRDSTNHSVIQKESRSSEADFGAEIFDNHRRTRREGKTCRRFSSRNQLGMAHTSLFPTCARDSFW